MVEQIKLYIFFMFGCEDLSCSSLKGNVQELYLIFVASDFMISLSGCRPLPVSERSWLHDSFQSSSGTEQVHQSIAAHTVSTVDCVCNLSNIVPVTMPWTPYTTTSGTSPSWSSSHVSWYWRIDLWEEMYEKRFSLRSFYIRSSNP